VEQLVITGVTTHLCCESTARSAFMRGFAVFMAIDGTATLNRELHLASLRALAHGFAVPLLVSDLLAALARAS
jgi:isochorismate hydrolase